MKYLSIIIPAYNEGERIKKTLGNVKDYLEKESFDYEVIIVNDGSSDNSKTEIKKIIDSWQNFSLIGYDKNRGKGAAIAYGVSQARGEYILFMDADESTPISQFSQFKQFISICPIIIGSRYLKKGYIKIKQPLWRIMFARFSNLLIRLILGLPYVDTQCGFKLFEKNVAKKIFSKMTLRRWGFDFEILKIAQILGFSVKEVPVLWYNEKQSKVRPGDFFLTLGELLKVRKNLKEKRYNL